MPGYLPCSGDHQLNCCACEHAGRRQDGALSHARSGLDHRPRSDPSQNDPADPKQGSAAQLLASRNGCISEAEDCGAAAKQRRAKAIPVLGSSIGRLNNGARMADENYSGFWSEYRAAKWRNARRQVIVDLPSCILARRCFACRAASPKDWRWPMDAQTIIAMCALLTLIVLLIDRIK